MQNRQNEKKKNLIKIGTQRNWCLCTGWCYSFIFWFHFFTCFIFISKIPWWKNVIKKKRKQTERSLLGYNMMFVAADSIAIKNFLTKIKMDEDWAVLFIFLPSSQSISTEKHFPLGSTTTIIINVEPGPYHPRCIASLYWEES